MLSGVGVLLLAEEGQVDHQGRDDGGQGHDASSAAQRPALEVTGGPDAEENAHEEVGEAEAQEACRMSS